MSSTRSHWERRIGAVALLVGGVLLASASLGVTPAAATGSNNQGNSNVTCNREGTSCWTTLNYGNSNNNNQGNPFTKILDQLQEILDKLNGGGGEGNHTLRWDQALPAGQRFVVLAAFNNEAVRDYETGLVWEKSPSTQTFTWFEARTNCITKNVGGRQGFRLPSIEELMSLVDPFASGAPLLPAGHPFVNVLSAFYWSGTTKADNSANAWDVNFTTGGVGNGVKAFVDNLWCVRGAGHLDAY